MKLNRCIRATIYALAFFWGPLSSSQLITETNEIDHLLDYADQEVLFVFDLDNTLIEAAQHLGSDQWFSHRMTHLVDKGHSFDDALNLVVPHWLAVQNRTSVRCVDPNVPELLGKLRALGVPMIALTKRPPELAKRTLEQLAPLQIDFSQSIHAKNSMVFPEHRNTLYQKGIIFVAANVDKGPVLSSFIQKMRSKPKKVVLIDDKMSHIHNVADAVKQLEIPFVGIRYGGADEKVKSFDPKVAELQWECFEKILSDEQAKHLLSLEQVR
jgi:hypothetical protein